MEEVNRRHAKVDTSNYFVLAPILPFVDICMQSIPITRRDYCKIENLTTDYQNDPRMIEMIRKCGDASAKVPYLMEEGETPDSILDILRGIAQPHVDRLQRLPEHVQAAIHLLLSINVVPRGYEQFGIPALLEIDRMQGEIVKSLHERMKGRQLAKDFQGDNTAALQLLDHDWPLLREKKSIRWPNSPLPETAQMRYKPFFDKADRLVYLHETCVIVDTPNAQLLRKFIPPVLQRPLPANVPVPATGSVDWMIRYVGKIGRHFTRALLGIIKTRLALERISLEAENYHLIDQRAIDALKEFVERTP